MYYKFYFSEMECRELQCQLFCELRKRQLLEAEVKLLALLVDRDLVGPCQDDDDS